MFSVIDQEIAGLPQEARGDIPWGLIFRYLIAFGLAGALLGFLVAGVFGRKGVAGWLLAFLGGVVVAIFGGVLGSFFGLVPDILSGGFENGVAVSVASGALLPFFALAGRPFLVALWLGLVVFAHVLAKRRRA